jgi:hypothetical protein
LVLGRSRENGADDAPEEPCVDDMKRQVNTASEANGIQISQFATSRTLFAVSLA